VADRSTNSQEFVELNTGIPHPARIYDYWLGGKDNFPADREAAEEVVALFPPIRTLARENRAFLRRAVRFLAGEMGIRQFLDIGAGLPTQENVHQVAQRLVPDPRVVYVDNDPIVFVHANALLADHAGVVAVQADVRDPDSMLGHPVVREVLDFDQPIGLLMVGLLLFVTDEEDPAGIVARFRDALAPGSYLAISNGTKDLGLPGVAEIERVYERATAQMTLRSHAETMRFFEGFELVPPGLVMGPLWRPDADTTAEPLPFYAGVGRKV